MKHKTTFARDLKSWRAELGLTQAEACKALGVTLTSLRNWEQGQRLPPHVEALRQLMKYKQEARKQS